jgi:hypothetical protein
VIAKNAAAMPRTERSATTVGWLFVIGSRPRLVTRRGGGVVVHR